MRRAAGWVVFAAALVGLGSLIHAGAPPTPRWTARIDRRFPRLEVKLCPDGRVLTMPYGGGDPAGPLEARDAETGRVLLSAWGDRPEMKDFCFSRDGGWAAGLVRPDADAALRWTDTRTGRQQEVPLGPGDYASAFLSPDARVVFAERRMPENRRLLDAFDRDSGRPIGSLPAIAGGYREFAGGWLLFNRPGWDGVQAWDAFARKRHAIPADMLHLLATPDGRRVLVENRDGYHLWAFDGAPRRVAAIDTPHKRVGAFSDDGRLAVIAPDGELGTHPVLLIDAETGRELWRFPLPDTRGRQAPALSPDGRFVAVEGDGGVWHGLDVERRRLGWRRPSAGSVRFSPGSDSVVFWGAGRRVVEVLDPATGEERATIPVPVEHIHPPEFAAGGRQVWLFALGRDEPPDGWPSRWGRWVWPPVPEEKAGFLLGLEWPTLRPVLRLTDRGVREFHVAEGGSFVLTLHDEGEYQLIRRWDVPPRKPWAWIVGVPLAVGAALLGLRAWRRRKEER